MKRSSISPLTNGGEIVLRDLLRATRGFLDKIPVNKVGAFRDGPD